MTPHPQLAMQIDNGTDSQWINVQYNNQTYCLRRSMIAAVSVAHDTAKVHIYIVGDNESYQFTFPSSQKAFVFVGNVIGEKL